MIIATMFVVMVVLLVGERINHQLKRLERKMDQERQALDLLTEKLTEHFGTVVEALAKIIELAANQDEDSSPEIAAIAAEVQASTEAIRAVLEPPVEEPPIE